VGFARRETVVELPPLEAFDLWADVRRWPTFIDGFARLERVDDGWPTPGSKVVWQSVPTGRGRVTEKVLVCERGVRLETQVVEERLVGAQTVEFQPLEDGAAAVGLALDYTLQRGGPLNALVDVIFIRRAQGDALARTLRRFATEAAEQAAL
jgi:uncharacterized membrane protein